MIYTSTSFLEQEQTVEVLKEDSIRLVDSAENGLEEAVTDG